MSLDPDAIKDWCGTHGIRDTAISSLSTNPGVLAEIQSGVDSLNAGLNHWETIKKFEVLPKELTVEGGELTPSLKVKRKVVTDEYSELIEQMYKG